MKTETKARQLVNIEASLTIKGEEQFSQKTLLGEQSSKASLLTLEDQKKFALELLKDVYEKTIKSFYVLIEIESPTPKEEDTHPLDDQKNPFD